MTIEDAVCERILDIPAVQAIVSDRAYLVVLPQGPTYPAVRVLKVDDIEEDHLRGPDGLPFARVQVDSYTDTESGVDPNEQMANLVTSIDGDGLGTQASGLRGWKGIIGGSPPMQILRSKRVLRLGPRYEGAELRILVQTQDYILWYREL